MVSKNIDDRMVCSVKNFDATISYIKPGGHEAADVNIRDSAGVTGTDYSTQPKMVADSVEVDLYDPNAPPSIIGHARLLRDDHKDTCHESIQQLLAAIETDKHLRLNDSPYPEVRSVVAPTDDPAIPINTFRVWILGTVFAIVGTGLDEFFGNRYPSIWIPASTAQLLSFPCGVAMARYLPTGRFGQSYWSFTLNPGPFNQKEHILIAVMSNVAFGNGTAYATTIFLMLKLDMYFSEDVMANSAGFRILLTLSTQLLGYGCAGIARRFLVYPPAMIWPHNLAQIALNKALHNDNGLLQVPGWKISRLRFATYCFVGMFTYFWLPGYLFRALSFFNWTTWIAPNNVTLAIVTGSLCGLGLNPWPTFDWNIIASLIDPIMSPFFSTVNTTIGLAVSAFFIVPLLYWYNVFNTAYLPINSNQVFDTSGAIYNVSRILNSDYTLNVAEYEVYGTPYLGAGYAVLLAAAFATTTALISHVLLYYWTELKSSMIAIVKQEDVYKSHKDIHNRLMKAYPEVPDWWFVIILLTCFILGCVICMCYPTSLPIWALCLAIILCIVLQVPIGIITAVTNVQLGNNVLAEFIAGYAIPNRPIANMIFKAFGTMGCAQSVQFSQDLKLGHYLKIPPRMMFAAQLYATLVGAFVSVGVNAWQMINIKDICQPTQSAGFVCPGGNTFFSAAIIWGVVGPERLFGPDGLYNSLEWGFLIGAVLPIPFWLLTRSFPNSFVRYVHVPVILSGSLFLAPYNFSFVWPACIFGFIFNFYIKRRYLAWWQKYAYVVTSSFGLAISISAIIIFFAVQFGNEAITWWGNDMPFSGVDGGGANAPPCLLRTLSNGERMPGT